MFVFIEKIDIQVSGSKFINNMLGHNICILYILKMRKDERKKTEIKKEKKSRQDWVNEGTMKKYEKRWKAESKVGDNMRSDKERKKRKKVKKMLLN